MSKVDVALGAFKLLGGDVVSRSVPFGHGVLVVNYHRIGNAELAVEFERSGMDSQRPRGHSRLASLVDDAEMRAEGLEPQGKGETGRPGADDEDFRFGHGGPR